MVKLCEVLNKFMNSDHNYYQLRKALQIFVIPLLLYLKKKKKQDENSNLQ